MGTTLPNFPIQVETSTLLRAAYVSNTMTTAGNVYGYYSIAGNDGTGGSRGGYFVANGTNGENNGVRAVANSGTTNIGVYSGASGGTTNWAAHFDYGYVIVDERVGIGTTSPVTELHVDGIVQIGTIERLSDLGINLMGCSVNFAPLDDNMWDLGTSSNRWDDVYATNGTIQTSDRRDKTNINNLSYGIREIMRLKPVTYRWKSGLDNRTKIGLIAQDVEAVIPEVVVTEDWVRAEDGTIQRKSTERLGMYYSDLIPVLIKGMQEQQQVINDLQSENRELREAMEDLAARVAKIEGRP